MAKKVPKHITLILNETPTIFLLDLASSTTLQGLEDAARVEEDNKVYVDLIEGKSRHRKRSTVETQTRTVLMKTRNTEPMQISYDTNSTFASNWEMYDTYLNEEEDRKRKEALNEELKENYHKLREYYIDGDRISSQKELLIKLSKNERFFEAALIIERLLANNCYNRQQKRFKGLSDPDLFRSDILYQYRLDLLWTFANDATKNRCVTALCLHPNSEDLIAAAYGKYHFIDANKRGIVMVWNIKNPQQPERQYHFQHPVTSLDFSKTTPNLLVVGFYNGEIKILDIKCRQLHIVKESSSTSFEPAWQVLWYQAETEEKLLASFGDGRVCRFELGDLVELTCVEIMKTPRIEGRLQGIEHLRDFEGWYSAIRKFAPIRCLGLHSTDPFLYFAGTGEGVVHKCSVKMFNKRLDVFKAHQGAIHAIKYSPFTNKLFITCGDDFQACIWADGIIEPLVKSRYCMEPVLDIDWSPTHSTILVSLRGEDILIWDFQRRVYSPQSKTKSPTNCRNTVCKFTKSGRCLIVGDVKGNIHVFALEDMPFPAFFQQDLFLQSLKKVLVTNPKLTKGLIKLGSLNY